MVSNRLRSADWLYDCRKLIGSETSDRKSEPLIVVLKFAPLNQIPAAQLFEWHCQVTVTLSTAVVSAAIPHYPDTNLLRPFLQSKEKLSLTDIS